MINLTIDGKVIEVSEGTTVLNAARKTGIEIPTLCDHPELTPYGGCRLCLVEVSGARTLQPSCTLPVSNGMVVKTDTEKTRAARLFILTMIFSERNHFCPFCQVSGGDCELQNAAYHEGMTHWPLQPNWNSYPMDASHPYIIVENNRCILCRRCVRACGELVGNFTLGFVERGARSMLVADLGVPLGTSSCISCGACVQVCPTGSLIDRWSAYKGRETEVDHTKTVCTGCSIGCGVDVLTRDNNLMRIEGDWEAEINQGVLCKVGRFYPLDEKRERLHTPLIRKNGALKAATWEDAIDLVSEKMKPLAGKADKGIAAIVSSKLSAETLYRFKGLFVNGLGSSVATSLEEGAYTSAASSIASKLGKSFEGSLVKLAESDCIVSFGADLVTHHEVAGFMAKRNIPNGTKIIVVDSNQNELAKWAEVALKPSKGISESFLNELMAAKIQIDSGKVKENDPVSQVLRLITKAAKPIFVVDKSIDAKTLSALVEFAGMVGAEIVNLKSGANSLAAAQYQLDRPFKVTEQQIGYFILGDEEPTKQLVKEAEKITFKVVQASYTSPLSVNADVVFPVTNCFEEEGHFVNFEGKVQQSHKSLNPQEGVWTNVAVLEAISKKLALKTKSDWKEALTKQISPVALQI